MNITTSDILNLSVAGREAPLQVAVGTTPQQWMQDNADLPQDAVAARVDGVVVDLKRPVESGAGVEFLTWDDPDGQEVYFHSCTHLMAQAVVELFPEAKPTIGPSIEDGYFYDFDVPKPFTPDDLQKIEKRMRKKAQQKIKVERYEMSRLEAIELFKNEKNEYKVEVLEGLAEEETVSFYKQADFSDLCRGPHIPDTGYLKHFKLLNSAGAYWRGDEHNPMLQRIYGTAAPSKEALEAYLQRLEEAKERDHRKLGKELDLFSIHEDVGAGLVLWHPMGARVRNLIENFWRNEHYRAGYELVYGPHIQRENLFIQSGHLENYSENMYAPMEIDGANYYAKPMNCPGHIIIYKSHLHSYRELPIRYAELGTVYRYERSGVLHGLLRVRGFTQDDAHIFCRPDQLEAEIKGVIELADYMMKSFGFEYKLSLALRPEKSIGSDEIWDFSIEALRKVLDETGAPYGVEEGGGAFYGPKIDVKLLDALGREWQGPTIQLDFNLPERFEVDYIDTDGERKRVVMIHRTVLGSMERFMGNLIEHYKGAFPTWLAPVQAKVLTITDDPIEYAQSFLQRLIQSGIRAELDDRNEKIGYKIREAESNKVPVMFIVGKKEAADGVIAVRGRGRKDLGVMGLDEALQHIKSQAQPPQPNTGSVN
ncbi:MAG: threonine--tRNA ligase [Candidatus Hinthialibacter antarcticus]|nr:threonine--tRNA ligase [Candidatus Hinthialibacter antarcticus]